MSFPQAHLLSYYTFFKITDATSKAGCLLIYSHQLDIITLMSKLRVGLFFGGRSTEHEVSIITALQAYQNLDKNKYEIIPVYVSKSGQFFSDPKFLDLKSYRNLDQLLLSTSQVTSGRKNNQGGFESTKFLRKFTPIDVALPLFHGSFGEDGCIQGLFEIYQIPYVGLNVMGSAVAMDKVISKAVFQSLGFEIAKFVSITRLDWQADSKKCLKQVIDSLKFPMFVKPADIGSTIGINKALTADELSFNIEVATTYADKILIEEAFEDCIEVNCAALGYREITPSVCEMPIRTGTALSYEDKYMRGSKGSKGSKGGMASLSRQIPAPISAKLSREIQETTVKVFKELEGCGVARIDYFVDPKTDKFWINEINSPPGSLAFYLYEPIGIKYSELLDRIIEDALRRFKDQQQTQFSFDSSLIQQMAQKSLSGGSKNGN